MPVTIRPEEGNSGGGGYSDVTVKELGYQYPNGLNLRPDSPLHQEVLAKVLRRADESFRVMQERHGAWGKIDELMNGFIPLSDYERQLKRRREEKDQVDARTRPVSIVVPYSYATLETLLTYLDEAFLVGTPLQYEGAGPEPEDEIGAKLLELAVDYQVRRQKAPLAMHTAFSDSLKYGMGVSTFEWVRKWGKKAVIRKFPQYNLAGQVIGVQQVRQNEEALLYEGNKLVSVDPYRYLPDPNVSVDRVQDGEFVGWSMLTSLYDLLSQEASDQTLFNVRYLKGQNFGGEAQRRSRFTPSNSRRVADVGAAGPNGLQTNSTRYVTQLPIFIKLIPKEWKLGKEEYPQTWLFTVADDTLLIRAMPIDMNHGDYPVAVAAPDYDGYSVTPLSRMETTYGLQEVLNWLFNSHIANVRKAINDMFIVDPSLVNMADVLKPGAGKILRLRRSAWGRGVDNAIKQLSVQDVTRGNFSDALSVMDMIQRASGAVDSVQGIMRNGGERRSATEAKFTGNNALSRLERLARIMGIQYMQDVGYFYASHTQQYMSQEIYAKLSGAWPTVLQQEFGGMGGTLISPYDISIDFDVVFKDGSVPTSGAANADVWVQLFQSIGTNPMLMQMFDVPRIFMHIGRLLGAKNIWDFVKRGGNVIPFVQPNEQVIDQAQAGNLVPVDQLAEAA